MTSKEKYDRLDDELKIFRISGVLKGIPLSEAEEAKMKRQIRKYYS